MTPVKQPKPIRLEEDGMTTDTMRPPKIRGRQMPCDLMAQSRQTGKNHVASNKPIRKGRGKRIENRNKREKEECKNTARE